MDIDEKEEKKVNWKPLGGSLEYASEWLLYNRKERTLGDEAYLFWCAPVWCAPVWCLVWIVMDITILNPFADSI
ncbi:hypothetical protein AVEN_264131-1, partial [Araneus ventricosus]